MKNKNKNKNKKEKPVPFMVRLYKEDREIIKRMLRNALPGMTGKARMIRNALRFYADQNFRNGV
jgi:hypothetical protein